MILFYFFILCILIICLYFYNVNKNQLEEFETKVLSQKKFDNFILKNAGKKAFNVGLKDIKIQRENCFQKCDAENCIKLYMKRRNYHNCVKCQEKKGKCFNNDMYTMGNCDDCGKNLKKLNCHHKNNIGCTDPNNIYSLDGIEPYFIEVPSQSANSPFDSKCVFCWQMESFL